MSHITVLKQEAVDYLKPKTGGVVVDATIGSAGHSLEICKKYPDIKIVGIDRDKDALERSREFLSKNKCSFILVEDSFKNLEKVLDGQGLQKVSGFLFDLGLNSEQLENSGRGFSFKKDEPLLMTWKKSPDENDFTAKDIVNDWSEESIANIIFGYGEERYARRIAKKIIEERKKEPIETTVRLVRIIKEAVPKSYRHGKIYFATKTFQALRIAVNDELESLRTALEESFKKLEKKGRIVVISFHGLEDKIVKEFFKSREKEGSAKIITKKPLRPRKEEIEQNPRSRSAKMRVIEKI